MMHNNNPLGSTPGGSKSSSFDTCVNVFLYIVCIVLGIAILVVAIVGYTSVSEYDSGIDAFKNNWLQKPIVDIQTGLSDCPSGYTKLISGEWPGTVEGCDCSRAWGLFYSNLYSSSCSRNQTRDGCYRIMPQKSVQLPKYYSYNLCGMRGGDNFVEARRPSIGPGVGTTLTCPTGYKLWGTGDKNTAVCARDQDKCPINDIYIVDGQHPLKPGYKSVPLDLGMSVAFSENGTGLPIVSFKITEGEVCANPNQQMASSGRTLYALINKSHYGSCSTKIAGSTTDPRYTKIGAIKENSLFDQNGVTPHELALPYFHTEDSLNYDWNLYFNRYNTWNADCEKSESIDRAAMVELLSGSNNLAGYQYNIMIVCIVHVRIKSFYIKIKIQIQIKFYFILTLKNI